VGAYVSPGEPLFSLIDAVSFHVAVYFKEQYLGPAVPGAKATVTLWQYPGQPFAGSEQSVGRGVCARNRMSGLPVVAKTLDWVQLAARIPVRIKLDTDKPLTMGTTADVQTSADAAARAPRPGGRRWTRDRPSDARAPRAVGGDHRARVRAQPG
jgi:multidrug efflux system membrane fusion protein